MARYNAATIKYTNKDGSVGYISGIVNYNNISTNGIDVSTGMNLTRSSNGSSKSVNVEHTIAAGYYTSGTIEGSYSLTDAAITTTPKVTQATYDGDSATNLTTDILETTKPTNYYKVEMVPSVDPGIKTEGYISDESQIDTTNGVTLTKYIRKGSVSSSAEGGSPVVTQQLKLVVRKLQIILELQLQNQHPEDGTDYLTVTPKGTPSAESEITPKMTFDSGYIVNAGEEGKKIVDATISDDVDKYYIPIVNPSFTGGEVSGNIEAQLSTSVTLSPNK